MSDTVPLDEWDRLVDRLRAWARDATVSVADDSATVEWRSARFTVHRDGRVDAGMPLHDAAVRAEELAFETDAVRVHGEGVEYTFRRP